MSYTVLARRYRSRDFDEVVGQEPIARTLRNAMESNRIAHAYLFCGTRGVGKTTMARLLARALNVTDELTEAEAIGDAIMRGEDLDVIEIDGASNRGVQEARDLIASSGLKPSRCPYRIYIIDEVHMLTRDAFNVLLKTMEEPPEHVKFILCTTEPNEVIQTIQSRCQRFDFRAIPAHLIAEHLEGILLKEGIEADADAVLRIGRLGEGSMRDALSILDRLLASNPDRLTNEVIEEMLGLPAQARIEEMLDAILVGDAAGALAVGGQLLNEGITIEQAIESMIDSLRTLLIVLTCGDDSDLLQLGPEQLEAVHRRGEGLDAAGVLHMIARCEATARHARFTASARALFDALLVRLSMAEHLASIPDLLRGTPVSGAKKKAPERVTATRRPTPSPVKPAVPVAQDPPETSAAPPTAQATSANGQEAKEDDSTPLGVEELWNRVLDAAVTPSAQAMVEGIRPVSWSDGILVLTLEDVEQGRGGYLHSRIDALTRLVRKHSGQQTKIEFNAPPAAPKAMTGEPMMENHPDVRMAMDLFDAVVVDVEEVPGATRDSKENT